MFGLSRWMRLLISLLLVFHLAPGVAANENHVKPISFVIAPDVLAKYQLFMRARRLDEVLDIDTALPRDVLEVLTTLYILDASGLAFTPEFVTSPSLERHLTLLESGAVAMSAAHVNFEDLQGFDGLQSRGSIVGDQRRYVGLYTAPGNRVALQARSRRDIRKLSAVSNKAWRLDWKALHDAQLSRVVSVSDWSSMCRMVLAGRVDFLLAPMPGGSADILVTPAGDLMKMAPFAAVFSAARRFVISSNHPDADELSAALDVGIASLGSNHFLHDALRQLYAPRDEDQSVILINPKP